MSDPYWALKQHERNIEEAARARANYEQQRATMNSLLQQGRNALNFPDPRDVAIQELKQDQQKLREEMAEMRAELTPLKQRMESLIGELLVALSEVRNPRQRDYFDPSKLVVVKGIDQ